LRLGLLVLALGAIVDGGALAAERLGLYQGKAFVTGTGEAGRLAGFATALEDVLVKVSGDQRLVGDPRVAALADEAAALVASFAYRDRMEGIPFHDEQGSRDRPHDLTVTFDPPKIDAALKMLGRAPWPEPRPSLALVVEVMSPGRRFMLAAEGVHGADMREALADAASLAGLTVRLPSAEAAAAIPSGALPDPAGALETLAAVPGADHVLGGSLTWSDAALGWVAAWRLDFGGKIYKWDIRGVSFDAAFRNALRGAAQVLSGSGAQG
jgi:hypothetical protein